MLPIGNANFPFGTGQYEDLTNGTPMPSNFFGQSGWWTVPTSWYAQTDSNGQMFVSPNANFSVPKYSVKVNQAGELVFFDMMRNLVTGNLRPGYAY